MRPQKLRTRNWTLSVTSAALAVVLTASACSSASKSPTSSGGTSVGHAITVAHANAIALLALRSHQCYARFHTWPAASLSARRQAKRSAGK